MPKRLPPIDSFKALPFRMRRTVHPSMDRRTTIRLIAASIATVFAVRDATAQYGQEPIRLSIISNGFTVGEMTETGAPRFQAFFSELRRLGLASGENLIVRA